MMPPARMSSASSTSMATHDNRATMFDLVTRTAEQCFMPLTVGGGVRTPEDVRRCCLPGQTRSASTPPPWPTPMSWRGPPTASAANASSWPSMPRPWHPESGRSSPMAAARHRDRRGGLRPHRGRQGRGRDPSHLDGPRRHAGGFNLPLTRAIVDAVDIPVIASGGVGTLDHLVEGSPGPRLCRPRRLDLPFRRPSPSAGQGPHGRRRHPREAVMSPGKTRRHHRNPARARTPKPPGPPSCSPKAPRNAPRSSAKRRSRRSSKR
jgi:hypothetical protein